MTATSDHYDAIVIGSGPGGASLAHRLAGMGKRILMLERAIICRVRAATGILGRFSSMELTRRGDMVWRGCQHVPSWPALFRRRQF
jgi:choline dehydrogenase-like flavoprotein